MSRSTFCVLVLCVFASGILLEADAATANEWRSRTIYQVITDRFARTNGDNSACSDLSSYCGGTFKGIINNLAYIQNMGFDAIWISPVVTNYGNNYHGYAATNINTINSHFGSAADLIALVQACHARGMYVMIDVVPNHMAAVGFNNVAQLTPFNKTSYFHDCNGCKGTSPPCSCADWSDFSQVEHCQLDQLLDLDQTNSFVATTLTNWVRNLVRTYGFDGIRIDTCPETAAVGGAIAPFLKSFAQTSGVYSICEVFDGRINYVSSYQTLVDGTMSYPLAMTLSDVFEHKKSMTEIPNTLSQYNQFKDTGLLGTFVDNHDNPRFLSVQSDQKLFQNALCYALMSTGIPIVYYGSEQGFHGGNDPYNREPLWTSHYNTSAPLYGFIKTVVQTRKNMKVWDSPQVQRFVDDSVMVFTRGSTLVAVTNSGSNSGTVTRLVPNHPYSVGTKLCNVFWPTQDCFTIQNGQLTINLMNGETKIYVPS